MNVQYILCFVGYDEMNVIHVNGFMVKVPLCQSQYNRYLKLEPRMKKNLNPDS